MKDKLLFGTIGLLVGIVVMQWTMPNGNASYRPPDASGIVAVLDGGTGDATVLDQNGTTWHCGGLPIVCWQQNDSQFHAPLPVPSAEIKFAGHMWLVTLDDHIWVYDRGGSLGWRDCGSWPSGTVAAEQSTWGKVKAQFGGRDGKP